MLKDFIENMQSYKGTHIRTTSATKMPEAGKHLEVPDEYPPKPREGKKKIGREGEATNMNNMLKERLSKLNKALEIFEKELELEN